MAVILFVSFSAMAMLPSRPTIESAGLFDENPAHIAIFFNDSGKEKVIASFNCGTKWETIKKESLPEKLYPLPVTGEIRYQIYGTTVVCSKDAGLTWKDVSPVFLFGCKLRDEIKKAQEAFNHKFSLWLPEYQFWPLTFSISVLILVLSVSIFLAKQHEPWGTAMLLSVAAYFLIGAALWNGAAYCVDVICNVQWNGYGDGIIIYPFWPLGIMLLLCGSPYLAPITAVICFPLTPLFNSKIMMQSSISRILRLTWILVALAFIIFIPVALFWGRGFNYYDYYNFP